MKHKDVRDILRMLLRKAVGKQEYEYSIVVYDVLVDLATEALAELVEGMKKEISQVKDIPTVRDEGYNQALSDIASLFRGGKE